MAKKYLDDNGLLYFWQKIKNTFALVSHTHTKSQITDFPTTMTPSSHTHGNITNEGALQSTDVAIANGDKLVVTDASNSNKVARTSVAFDGSTATQALTKKGTFETFNNYTHPAYTAKTAAAVKVGNDATGHVVTGDALTAADVSAVPTTRKVNNKALSADITVEPADIPIPNSIQGSYQSAIFQQENPTTLAGLIGTTDNLAVDVEGKVDAETGKGLSTNDFTTADKTHLDNAYQFALSVDSEGTVETSLETLDGSDSVTLLSATARGAANGVCPLNASSKIDSTYLPSYVDDVIEAYARSGATALTSTWLSLTSGGAALTPETGKIYVLMADSGDYAANSQFRWSGSAYVKLADGGVSSITNAEIDTIVAS